jgi:hypothetical protein
MYNFNNSKCCKDNFKLLAMTLYQFNALDEMEQAEAV